MPLVVAALLSTLLVAPLIDGQTSCLFALDPASCTSSNGSSVTVGGRVTTPGSGPSTPHAPWSDGGGPLRADDTNAAPSRPLTPAEIFANDAIRGVWEGICAVTPASCAGEAPPPTAAAPIAPESERPAVTASDLVSFSPSAPDVSNEPAGLGVAGMSTNFVARASPQILEGDVLGVRVSVRFTPAEFRFDYGDGEVATRGGGGQSWADLGVADYTHTDTSHVYRERGEYTARIEVVYSAEIDAGDGWIGVAGTVTSAASVVPLQIVSVTSALVARSCLENPSGPAC